MSSDKYKYQRAVVGGTFDHLHHGHIKLLEFAFKVAGEVIIGLTSDAYVINKKFNSTIQPFETRQHELIQFLTTARLGKRFKIIEIDDVYGTTLEDRALEAIIVSTETIPGAELINQKRIALEMEPLEIEVVTLLEDQDSDKLSATHIRQGLVDSQGKVFRRLFEHDIVLNDDQIDVLKIPMGNIYTLYQIKELIIKLKPTFISVVGDITLGKFIEHNLPFDLGVYDNMTKRVAVTSQILPNWPIYKVANSPGRIETKAVRQFYGLLDSTHNLIQVTGEEDLLVLPLILLQPLGSLIFYGQPNVGIVCVTVDEDQKNTWYRFLSNTDKINEA